jgi:type II secretory pathway component GspD/PulD (secretin)
MGASARRPRAPIVLAAADTKAQPTPDGGATESDPTDADATNVDPDLERRAREIVEKFQNADAPADSAADGSDGTKAGGQSPSPIRITRGPNGLVITSNDTQALDQLQDLIDHVQPQRDDFKIFHLKFAYALSVKLNLEDIFDDAEDKDSNRRMPWYYYEYGNNNSTEKPSRLSQRRKIKFIDDYDTNTILVKNADPVQLRKVEEIIKFYDKPEPPDSQSIRKIEIFKLDHAKAQQVAEVIKEVYRDLLSANDKALQNGQQQQQEERRVYYYDNWGDGDDTNDTKMPKFKGLLSIGIDAPSNSLIVSAPEFLMRGLKQIIADLDAAARPSSTVQVVKVGQYLKGKENRAALARMIGSAKQAAQGEGDKGQEGQGQNGQPGGPQGQNGGQQGNQ